MARRPGRFFCRDPQVDRSPSLAAAPRLSVVSGERAIEEGTAFPPEMGLGYPTPDYREGRRSRGLAQEMVGGAI